MKLKPSLKWAGRAQKTVNYWLVAESHFDIFVTADQNLQYQQNLQSSGITIFVLKSSNSRYETLKLLIPKVLDIISRELKKGIIEIS